MSGGSALNTDLLGLLRCPATGEPLVLDDGAVISVPSGSRYPITASGIPLFAGTVSSDDAKRQQDHYDHVARAYLANVRYPHTQEYNAYLDRALLEALPAGSLGTAAELCCGHGEALQLVRGRFDKGIGVDMSLAMLESAASEYQVDSVLFVQGDATRLPLASESFDSVFILGGVHHVPHRSELFGEVARILKPGGRLYFREPVSDLFLWRALRWVVYRLSPALDHETEQPLRRRDTVSVLESVGLNCEHWMTYGFVGFCLFMNSDVLVVNRLLRFVPGIRTITRSVARVDDWLLRTCNLRSAGLQVVGVAKKL